MIREYTKDHCWQFDIRIQNAEQDILDSGLTKEQVENLKVSDFYFKPLTTDIEKKQAKLFIERHEWLGTISQFTTHWFGAFYEDNLAGVLLFNMPNAFSKLMGENTSEIERLLSRGACISWSPKNLASSFVMWSIKWMVNNTQYRLFTAYSDPMAKELGTIYQACNFYYLGNESGGRYKYINPYNGKIVSDRFFRQRTAYRKYCKELGIIPNPAWFRGTGMQWKLIPEDIETALRNHSKLVQSRAEKIEVPLKHKYAIVLGKDRTETKKLKKIFEQNNKIYPYPKTR